MVRALSFVLTCEHATASVPAVLDLGIADTVRLSHVGWDRRALHAAERLQRALNGPLLVAAVSRLVVDCNRSSTEPQVVPETSFGVSVPGNADLTPEERSQRLGRWWHPFRQATEQAVAQTIADGRRCIHLSVHSFTPSLDPVRRTYPLGLLFDPSRPLEAAIVGQVVGALRTGGLDVRENEPYLGVDDGHTTALRTRFADEVYAGIEVEVNDGLTESEVDAVVDALAAELCGLTS